MSHDQPDAPQPSTDSLRIDKWLWCARFFKSGSLAQQAVEGGHVQVNGERAKASRQVKVGDRLRITRERERFEGSREWCLESPEIVNVSGNTPYPGTETWATEGRKLATRDYRLFDIQHTVLPTKLPLPEFYAELVRTQQVLNR